MGKDEEYIEAELVQDDIKREEPQEKVQKKLVREEADHIKEMKAESSARINLLNFVNNRIKQLESRDELKSKTIEVLLHRLENETDEVTTLTLVKLLEALNKHENESTNNLFNLFKPQVNLQLPDGGGNHHRDDNTLIDSNTGEQIDKKEFEKSKRIYDMLETIKKEQEKENSKKVDDESK